MLLRLLLDAHLSGKRIGGALEEGGHDVKKADDESLEGWDDEPLLELARSEGRIMVTRNGKDFVPIVKRWVAEGRSHAGLIVVPPRIDHDRFGAIIRGIEGVLRTMAQEEWIDQTRYIA